MGMVRLGEEGLKSEEGPAYPLHTTGTIQPRSTMATPAIPVWPWWVNYTSGGSPTVAKSKQS